MEDLARFSLTYIAPLVLGGDSQRVEWKGVQVQQAQEGAKGSSRWCIASQGLRGICEVTQDLVHLLLEPEDSVEDCSRCPPVLMKKTVRRRQGVLVDERERPGKLVGLTLTLFLLCSVVMMGNRGPTTTGRRVQGTEQARRERW